MHYNINKVFIRTFYHQRNIGRNDTEVQLFENTINFLIVSVKYCKFLIEKSIDIPHTMKLTRYLKLKLRSPYSRDYSHKN